MLNWDEISSEFVKEKSGAESGDALDYVAQLRRQGRTSNHPILLRPEIFNSCYIPCMHYYTTIYI
jgi:hypothetical protein